LTFLVAVVVARYLGPEDFGILSYALSLTSLIAVAGHMGLVGLVVRELVKRPECCSEILGTVCGLKFFGVSVGYALLVIYAFVYETLGSSEFILILLLGLTLFLVPFNVVIDSWFQSRVQAKYKAIASLISMVLTSLLKVAFVGMGGTLIAFGFANLLQPILVAAILMFLFHRTAEVSLLSWRFRWTQAQSLLARGAPIFLASFFATIYLRVDLIMLRWFVGPEEVGLYAVASRLSEVWYFLPSAVVVSVFPRLIQLRKSDPDRFQARFQQLFDILFMAALAIALIFTFLSTPLIKLFFGADYGPSAPILSIHVWAGIFIFMRAGFSKWILIEDALWLSLITQAAGAVVNVGLNVLFIPSYGGVGAAWATLISYAVASYFALFFHRKSRGVFMMMTKAIIAPMRYLLS
jgi:O-antigen/teichoic acid export membrane protein